MSHLAFDHVQFGYTDTLVLNDISFTIHSGEYVGIVGPSGAGKTTILKLLMGLEKPSHGSVHTHSQNKIGYCPQLSTVDWYFPITADQVVGMGLRNHAPGPFQSKSNKEKIQNIMTKLGIISTWGRHIRDLSGGQQQRVFLARALVSEPETLILDEPTANVDMKSRDQILHLLDHLSEKGLTIIVTIHDLTSAAAHIPRTLIINQTLKADGSPKKIFTKKVLDDAYGSDVIVFTHERMLVIADQPHRME